MQHLFSDLGRRFTRAAWRIGLILGTFGGTALAPFPAGATAYTFTIVSPEISSYGIDAYGVNDSGQIIETVLDGSASWGSLYDSNGTVGQSIIAPPLIFNGSYDLNSFVRSINDSGQIVGYSGNFGPYPYQGFLYDSGSYTAIDVPGAFSTQAYGINNRGQIVGSYRIGDNIDSSTINGFLYDHGSFITINVPGAASTTLYGINDRGQIVGTFYSGSASEVFLYDHGRFTTIGGAYDLTTLSINDSDQILINNSIYYYNTGSVINPNPIHNPFTYDPSIYVGHFRDLGINNKGDIVGYFYWNNRLDGLSGDAAFLAVPDDPPDPPAVPEPSSLALLIPGLIGLMALHRREAVKRGCKPKPSKFLKPFGFKELG